MCDIGNQTVCRDTFLLVKGHLHADGVPNRLLHAYVDVNGGCLADRKRRGERITWLVDKANATP